MALAAAGEHPGHMGWLDGYPRSSRPWSYELPAQLKRDWWAAARTGGAVHHVESAAFRWYTKTRPEGFAGNRASLIVRTTCTRPRVLNEPGRRMVKDPWLEQVVDHRAGKANIGVLPICRSCLHILAERGQPAARS